MNNTKVYFVNEKNKLSWNFADIITIQNRQYGLTTHETGGFTAYDVKSGMRIGKYNQMIELIDRINEPEFDRILDSKEYQTVCKKLELLKKMYKEVS